ncbi:MAG: SoxR reducing system RseC family protein [Magnetovibrionaceae bacterium]
MTEAASGMTLNGPGGCTEGHARVVAVGEAFVWVEAEAQSACKACSSQKGCGVSAAASYFGRKPVRFSLPNTFDAHVGERIVIGLSHRAVLGASALLYFLPAVGLIIGAILGDLISHNPFVVGAGALIGGLVGFWPARRNRGSGSPVYLRRADG